MLISAQDRELIWQSSRYALALWITTCAISVVPAFIVIVTAALGFIVGIVVAGVFLFGADPPIFGFLAGIYLSVLSVLVAIAALLLIGFLAFILAGAIITPLALTIRFAFGYLRIRSRPLTASVFCLLGAIIGLGMGLIAYQVITLAKWEAGNHTWDMIALSVIGTIGGGTATTIYGSVLLAVDAIRARMHLIDQDLAKNKGIAPG